MKQHKFNAVAYGSSWHCHCCEFPMRMFWHIVLLVGLLPVSCNAVGLPLPGHHESKALASRHDLLLMANERQVVHYRYLAAEQVGVASRLAEDGDIAGTTRMLFSAIEYQALAEEMEAQNADRTSD